MINYLVESNCINPWRNLAIEKHLADHVRPGDLLLYLWQNANTVVIGRNQNALRECNAQLLESEGGVLARRTTGGGAVYHDLGNLCFTFVASPERYDLERQMKVIQNACRRFGIETKLSGRNDIITEDGFKFSGNAFSVTATCKIQHGTLLIDVNKEKLSRYLTPSKEKMQAKGVKSVQSRVRNLKELCSQVTVEAMKEALAEAFAKEYGTYQVRELDLDSPDIQETYDIYASWEWRYGKSPECEVVHSKRFEWGEVQVHLKMKHLHIEECKVYSDSLDVEFPQRLENVLINQRFDLVNVENEDEKINAILEWLRS
jgi:lipoate-protein ligase A